MFEQLRAWNLFASRYESLNASGKEVSSADDEANIVVVRRRESLLIPFLAVVITSVVAFFAGRMSTDKGSYGLELPNGHVRTVWHLNHTFSGVPSPESEAAWQSLIPEGRGFITHPTLSPNQKGLTVFHELHCLHALQLAYHTISPNPSYFLTSLGANTSPGHIEHCFDYLRQAIMCAADTNFEDVEPETKATNGWGSERVCRNYWGVVDWAERWRSNDERTILGSVQHHHEGNEGKARPEASTT